MTPWAIVRAVLWLLSALFLAAAFERVRGVSLAHEGSVPPSGDAGESPSPIATDSLNTLADRIVDADVFRLARRPSPVTFGASADAGMAKTPAPPKPPLALSGVIGGPPWTGLLDGVPGRDQSVLVHAGDTLGGLRVRSVTRNRVVVAGLDTTWQLTVRDPWH